MTQRVLFTASTASHIRNFHLPYLRRFCELGWEVTVACGAPAGEIPFAHRVIALPFAKRITAPENFQATRLLHRELARTRYDLVLTHTSLAAFFTRLALPGGKDRPRVVNMVHGYLFAWPPAGWKDRLLFQAERMTASRTDLVLTMNRTDGEIAWEKGLGRAVGSVPGVGVDFSRLDGALAMDRQALRAQMDIPEDAFVLLYAAEFSRRKNQAVLLRALSQLPERVVLALPGQGTLWGECKALAQTLGVAERVIFPGQVADMAPWYALADAAVSASCSEGLPFNIMEAMYAALPVVASAVKGHTDLLEQGRTGLLCPPEDADSFARAVEVLLGDPALCQRLGSAAREAVRPYALETVLPQVMERYLAQVPAAV